MNFKTIVLGCTHYIYYKKLIEKIAGKGITVIDGNHGTARNLMNTVSKIKSSTSHKGGGGGGGGGGDITFIHKGLKTAMTESKDCWN
jgi:glutamate racemase